MGQAAELETGVAERQAALIETNRVGWHLLHFMRDALTSLEEQATRVVAAQIAGLIAIWTQLGSFESGLPSALIWPRGRRCSLRSGDWRRSSRRGA